ncbi:MAG: Hsp33 family molecular chaperone HslO [Balneolaceae bacterium]
MIDKETFQFRDRMIRGLSVDGHFRIAVVKSTDLVEEARTRHNLSPLATVLLGRTLTAAALLASSLKGEERLRLRLEGTGPVGHTMAEANRVGEVRGYVRNPDAGLDYNREGISIGEGLGAGLLTATKVLYNEAEPQTSTIQLFRGDVTTDVANYLTRSEQLPSAVLLDEQIGSRGEVLQAGGLLVQKMPGAPEEEVVKLQEKLARFEPVSKLLSEKLYIDKIMKRAVQPWKVKEVARQPLHFFCRCSRERFISALSMLNYRELEAMEGEPQEMVCHFCGNSEEVSPEEVRELAVQAKARMN